MEKNFYNDNFENFLKESTDNFRMYPSKRVWHSIYNDLHPSRRWPSLAVCLLLISAIMYISITHQNDLSDFTASNLVQPATLQSTNIAGNTSTSGKLPVGAGGVSTASAPNREILTNVSVLTPNNPGSLDKSSNAGGLTVNDFTGGPEVNVTVNEQQTAKIVSNPGLKISASTLVTLSPGELETDLELVTQKLVADKQEKDKKKSVAIEKFDDKEWIEDFAFHNKPFASKWKSKAAYQFYVTPSIGFRKLSRNTKYDPVIAQSLVAAPVSAATRQDVSHIPAVNMELGANILYNLSKKINLRFGVQFNYTNYNINAYDLRHPTMTTVMLNDLNTGYPYMVSKSTHLGNIDGVYNTRLNNNTYQVSLPVGADVKLAGKNNVKWYAGASIQPTYVAGGQSYLISSDLKNYVDGNSMMRNWNLNAGIETFVSYKTKSGIILNAGPQFRYQVLSTLTNEYTYDEQLYNLGIKIGVVTKF